MAKRIGPERAEALRAQIEQDIEGRERSLKAADLLQHHETLTERLKAAGEDEGRTLRAMIRF